MSLGRRDTLDRRAVPFAAPVALALLLPACVAAPSLPGPPIAAAPAPRFDAFAFFTGRLRGEGRLARLFSRSEATLVESRGRIEGDVLVLEQVVHEGRRPARTRRWTMREVAPGRYRGTLTDAEGPVTGESVGNRLHLAFVLKGGLPTEQWLTLSPDGRRADNVMTIRKFGVTVAVLSETITKLD